jgi:hypothetical protein
MEVSRDYPVRAFFALESEPGGTTLLLLLLLPNVVDVTVLEVPLLTLEEALVVPVVPLLLSLDFLPPGNQSRTIESTTQKVVESIASISISISSGSIFLIQLYKWYR